MRSDDEFLKLFDGNDAVDRMRRSPNSCHAIWDDLTLAFVNDAWDEFARDNGATEQFFERWKIGTSIRDALGTASGARALDNLRLAFATGEIQTFTYECSTPAVFRLMQATFIPLSGHDRRACLISHATVVRMPHSERGRVPHPAIETVYRDERGMITMCCECRRTRRPRDQGWDWVPEFLRNLPELTSHGLCEACFAAWASPIDPRLNGSAA